MKIILLLIPLLMGFTLPQKPYNNLVFGEKLAHVELSIPHKIHVTSYNPDPAQTDFSPCIGAGSEDLCRMRIKGRNILALSQDLVAWTGGTVEYGSTVTLKHDNPKCNGDFEVRDTMNKRWTMRGDIFFMYRDENTSCEDVLLILKS